VKVFLQEAGQGINTTKKKKKQPTTTKKPNPKIKIRVPSYIDWKGQYPALNLMTHRSLE